MWLCMQCALVSHRLGMRMPSSGGVPGPSSSVRSLCRVLWAVSLMGFSASGQHLCPRESIGLLRTIIQQLGNSSERTLYTPENRTVCYAHNLKCFHGELEVMELTHNKHQRILGQLSQRLKRLQAALQRSPASHCRRRAHSCPPCESNPEQPVPAFLNALLELLQWKCKAWAGQGPGACPSPAP